MCLYFRKLKYILLFINILLEFMTPNGWRSAPPRLSFALSGSGQAAGRGRGRLVKLHQKTIYSGTTQTNLNHFPPPPCQVACSAGLGALVF